MLRQLELYNITIESSTYQGVVQYINSTIYL